ncbi:MAG: rRNA maturation RNase YbeY [Rickettsiales bacterium]
MTVDVIVSRDEWNDALGDLDAFCATLVDACRARLPQLGKGAEWCVNFSDDAEVARLNYDFRGKNESTNVLSFPSDDVCPDEAEVPREAYLGDVIFAFETVAKEAEEGGLSLREHTAHLFIHGLLHMLGYDHETDRDAGAMEALEIDILADLGIENPY